MNIRNPAASHGEKAVLFNAPCDVIDLVKCTKIGDQVLPIRRANHDGMDEVEEPDQANLREETSLRWCLVI